MNCQEVRPWLSAFHDREVDLVNEAKIRAHLADCPDCRSELRALESLSRSIRDIPRSSASDDLRNRIEASLPGRRSRVRGPWGLVFAFGSGAVATLAIIAFLLPRATAVPDSLTKEILDSHVSALMLGHPIDVASSDQHTVKPWFSGRVPISPTPWDLSAQGFPLAGGRLAVIDGRPTPVFVYRRRKHLIDLYVLASPAGGSWKLDRQGYTMIAWPQAGLEYIAVSDVAPADLQRFEELYRKQG